MPILNPNIRGPGGAVTTLKQIDWSRVPKAGFSSYFSWGASSNFGNQDLRADYAGKLVQLDGKGNFALPSPEYYVRRQAGFESFWERMPKHGVPLEMLHNHGMPGIISLNIYSTPEEAEAVGALTQTIIPNLFMSSFIGGCGFAQDAVVYVGKNMLRRTEKGRTFDPLLSVGKDGLEIFRTRLNGRALITRAELNVLKDLRIA